MNEDNVGVKEDNPPSLDLFSEARKTEADIIGGRTVVYHCNVGNKQGPYEFTVESDGPEYILLPQTRLYGKVKITRTPGHASKEAETTADSDSKMLGISNILPSALFQQVLVEVNSQLITDSSAKMYPYKAYLETLLSYGLDAEQTHLQAARYLVDTSQRFTQRTLITAEGEGAAAAAVKESEDFKNSGLYLRTRWLQNEGQYPNNSKTLDFSTPIFTDFFRINRLLPDKCQLRIKFDRGMDTFPLITGDTTGTYSIEITELQLHVRKVQVSDRVKKIHEASFAKKQPAIFPINRTVMSSYVLPTGVTSYIIPRIIKGQMPKMLLLGLVDAKGYNGDIQFNPFLFEHANITSINLRVDGVSVPSRPYKSNFGNKKSAYVEPYVGLMNALGYDGEDKSCNLSLAEYKNGFTLFGFDLSPDQCSGYHKHPVKTGTIDVEITFKESLSTIYTLIAYSVYDNNLFINQDRNLSADYLF